MPRARIGSRERRVFVAARIEPFEDRHRREACAVDRVIYL